PMPPPLVLSSPPPRTQLELLRSSHPWPSPLSLVPGGPGSRRTIAHQLACSAGRCPHAVHVRCVFGHGVLLPSLNPPPPWPFSREPTALAAHRNQRNGFHKGFFAYPREKV